MMKVFVVIEYDCKEKVPGDRRIAGIKNLEAFNTAAGAAAAVRRLGWAERVACDLESGVLGNGSGVQFRSIHGIVEVGVTTLEGVQGLLS